MFFKEEKYSFIKEALILKQFLYLCSSVIKKIMRMLVKRLLKKYKYPPEGQEDALKTVISQCEMWTDNQEYFEHSETTQNEKANKSIYDFENHPSQNLMVAEESPNYGN